MIENSILASIITIKDVRKKAIDILSPDFFHHENKTIYEKVVEMEKNGLDIDIVTLSECLSDSVDVNYLTDLFTNTATSLNIEYFIKAEKDSQARALIREEFKNIYNKIENNEDISSIIESSESIIEKFKLSNIVKDLNKTGFIVRINDLKSRVLEYKSMGFKNIGVHPGWESVAKFYKPAKGMLNIVTGMPSHGKSEWMDALMINLSNSKGWKWAVFSPENFPYEMHIQKLIEKCVGKSFWECSDQEIETYLLWLDEHFFFLEPAENDISLNNIIRLQKKSIEINGIDGCLIDPWNEIEMDLKYGGTETDYIGRSLSKCRRFARKYKQAYYIVAHPAKMYPDKDGVYPVPTLYSISGSAHWKNKADNGIVVHIHENTVEIHIQKVKFKVHGKQGLSVLKYDLVSGRYEDYEKDKVTVPWYQN